MPEPSQTDTLLLKLAVAKGLVDKTLAKEIFAQARSEGRSPEVLLIERGVLTQHGVDALQKDAAKARAPKEIGGYRLGKKLGQGGMGAVYRATQISMGREVAVKLIAPGKAGGKAAAERFMREARAAGKVNHPHVITVYDVGQVGGTLYLAMELVTGGDAEQAAKAAGGRLPERHALEIIRDAARGLAALEEAGLMHRDIKPANIFIAKDGSAKLADLGLARSADGDDRMTQTGATMGTPAYMSPEQANGAEDIDIRTDIYALGATLYALICGESPYRGNSPWAVVAAVIRDPFPDPAEQGCSSAVAELILRCCAKNPKQRIASAAQLVEQIDYILSVGPGNNSRPVASTPLLPSSSPHGIPKPSPMTASNGARNPGHQRKSHDARIPSSSPRSRMLPLILIGTVVVVLLSLLVTIVISRGDHTAEQVPITNLTTTANNEPRAAEPSNVLLAEAPHVLHSPSNAARITDPSRWPSQVITSRSERALIIGPVEFGDVIAMQYIGGMWKGWGGMATSSPDDASDKYGNRIRLCLAEDIGPDQATHVLQIVPPNTAETPFLWHPPRRIERLVFRINDGDGRFDNNPDGGVTYRIGWHRDGSLMPLVFEASEDVIGSNDTVANSREPMLAQAS
ncbi:MAG: serine/threonine protein kinase, partial [Planctomycetota bacterium]